MPEEKVGGGRESSSTRSKKGVGDNYNIIATLPAREISFLLGAKLFIFFWHVKGETAAVGLDVYIDPGTDAGLGWALSGAVSGAEGFSRECTSILLHGRSSGPRLLLLLLLLFDAAEGGGSRDGISGMTDIWT